MRVQELPLTTAEKIQAELISVASELLEVVQRPASTSAFHRDVGRLVHRAFGLNDALEEGTGTPAEKKHRLPKRR